MTIEQNKAIIRQLIEDVINNNNEALADELITADFVENEELGPGMPTGREGVKQAFAMMHSAFPDFNATVEDVIAEGDKVVIRMTWSGTHKGEFMGIPASGKQFSVPVIDIFRLADGKIAEHWGLTDMGSMMQQLGVIPGPGEG